MPSGIKEIATERKGQRRREREIDWFDEVEREVSNDTIR